MCNLHFKIRSLAAFAVLLLLCAAGANAAGVVVAWNSVVGRGGAFAHATYATPYGFSSPVIDDAGSSDIRAGGITLFRHESPGGFDFLRFQNVPSALSLSHYVEFDVSPKAGLQFDPFALRIVLFRPNQDANASYQVRSSADAFSSVIGNSIWNGTAGSSYNILEADLSSMGAFTAPTTFRLYMSDASGDGGIFPVGSTASWPYGVQLVAESTAVPEPSAATLIGLGLLGLSARRRRA
jgi:hypothetical protein